MWWLKQRLQVSETGASAVIVALMMVLFLAVAAISVDVGKLYWEKAQLQNGADAAALAAASECAPPKGDHCDDAQLHFAGLVNANASDDVSRLRSVEPEGPNGIRVWTDAIEPGLPALGSISLWFADALSQLTDGPPQPTAAVPATAVASWVPIGSGPSGFPLIFEECVFELAKQSAESNPSQWFVFQTHGEGPAATSDADCTDPTPAGWNFPGAFGWLDLADGTACATSTSSVGGTVTAGGSTGNPVPKATPGDPCGALLTSWKPIVDSAIATGNDELFPSIVVFAYPEGSYGDSTYTVSRYVTLQIRGWRFPGTQHNNLEISSEIPGCTAGGGAGSNCFGFIGRFVEETTADPAYGGGGPDGGSYVVQLTE